MALIDFTNMEIDLQANYGGSDKKRGILYNGERYMLKLSDQISEEHRNSLNSSYSNSAFSEHISCRIIKELGFDVQETLLGVLNISSKNDSLKTYPVVACKNFTNENWSLVEFKFIESALLDVKPPKTPKIEHIYEIMTNENAYFSYNFGKVALERYWDTFIIDSLLANFDRHANNWGYLVNSKENKIKLAPIYDCGSCLYPQLTDEAMERILNDEAEILKRINVFPTAALTENNNKISYRDYIYQGTNKDCLEALLRVAPKININKINNVINDIAEISDIRKDFYKKIITKRYEFIILEAYNKFLKINQNRLGTKKCL